MKITDIEYTPNPNAVKFIVDAPLTMPGQSRTFTSIEDAEDSPLASALLEVDHVQSVYFYGTWLTITQDGEAQWRPLLKELAVPIRAAERPTPAGGDGAAFDDDEDAPGRDDPRWEQIEEVLDDYVRPYLEFDGGGVQIRGIADNQVMIRYEGACGTCPSAATGTMMAIEAAIQREVDDELEIVLL